MHFILTDNAAQRKTDSKIQAASMESEGKGENLFFLTFTCSLFFYTTSTGNICCRIIFMVWRCRRCGRALGRRRL